MPIRTTIPFVPSGDRPADIQRAALLVAARLMSPELAPYINVTALAAACGCSRPTLYAYAAAILHAAEMAQPRPIGRPPSGGAAC